MVILLIVGGCFTAMVTTSPSGAWLAWIGLIPIILAVRMLPPKGAAIAGVLWGGSIYCFAVTLPGSTVAPVFIDGLIIAAAPAVYAFLMSCYRRHFGFSPLAMALGWVALEWIVRATGMPQGLPSVDRGFGPVFEIIADFLGYGFVAFILAYINAVLISIPVVLCLSGFSVFGNNFSENSTFFLPWRSKPIRLRFYPDFSRPRAPPV